MIDVLYEDNHLIAIHKPAGALAQGDHTGDAPVSEAVKDYIKKKYGKPGAVFLGTVHRLDRPTTGILLFARTSKATQRMNAQFRDKETEKTYWAIVEGHPTEDEQRLEHWLVKDQIKNKSRAYNRPHKHGKHAIMRYRVRFRGKKYSWLEIQLETGRHHQIRSQLSTIGHPVVGDLKYGARRSNPDGSICLHAQRLGFIHPVKKEPVEIVCPAPELPVWKAIISGKP